MFIVIRDYSIHKIITASQLDYDKRFFFSFSGHFGYLSLCSMQTGNRR